jgi:hypothetical protein
MISNSYNLTEDWGWFIDIESSKPIYDIKTQFVKTKNKKINYNYNKLAAIEDDEYDYYINNIKDTDYIHQIKKPLEILSPLENTTSNIITKYGSTTLITALLTYVVFFVL